MNDVFAFWGCGKGPLRSLKPHIRILSGVLLGITVLMVPLPSASGIVVVVAAAACWCALSGMPAAMVARCAIASAILFFPFLLLTPWMAAGPSGPAPVIDRIANAGSIALRSTCCLFIAASTIAALAVYEAHSGLASLPLPRALVALIVQIINQTMVLSGETVRIVQVLRLRGASGMRGAGVLFSFPVVWMVRMLFRAERTAAAMTVRGYGVETATEREKAPLAVADILAVVAASAVFALSVVMRLRTFA